MKADKKTKEQASLEVAQLARRIADSETCELSAQSVNVSPKDHALEYTALLDLYDGLAYVCTHTYEVIRVSAHLAARLGGKIVGEKCFGIIHGLDEPCSWCHHEMLSIGETGGGIVYNQRLRQRVYVATSPFRDPEGHYLRVGLLKELQQPQSSEDTSAVEHYTGNRLEERLRRGPAALFVWRAAEGWPVESISGNVEQYGYKGQELVAARTKYSQLIHVDDVESVASELGRHAMDGIDDFVLQYRLMGADGKAHLVNDTVRALRHDSGFITHYETMVIPAGGLNNCLATNSAGSEPGTAEKLFPVLFHNFPFGLLVFRCDQEDRLVLAAGNAEAGKLAGIRIDQKVGAQLQELWDNPDRDLVAQRVLETKRKGTRAEINNFRQMIGRQERVLRLSIFKISSDHVGLTLEDIVQQRQIEEKLRKTHEEMERRLAERTADLSRTNWLLKREVSERKTSEDALRQSELKYHTLLERLPVGVISCDLMGDIVEINATAAKILGLPPSQTAGSVNLVRLPLLAETGASEAVSKCLTVGESFEGDVILRNRWGKDMYIRLHTSPIRSTDGRIIRAQVLMEDVSDYREAQELLVKTERLKTAGKMTGGVAQTFSGLLHSVTAEIQAAIEAAEQGNLPKIRRKLEELLDSTRDAAQRLRRLQQFAKARPDTGVMLGTIFNISEAVREASEAVRQWSQSQPKRLGVDIALDLDLSPACYVGGDRSDITEVIINLMKNAVEALTEGGKIAVRTRLEENQVTLQVQDNGVGVLKKDIETIFEPFWTTKSAHAGLGLAVNVGIIRRHGGRIVVRSRRGTGTVFTVSFPGVEAPAEQDQMVATQLGPLYFRILIIDEDDAHVRSMEEGLRGLGQTVITASSGVEGLQIFEEKEVDAVICELVLSDMNGWEVSKSIQSICVEKGIPKPPFIMVTSWARQLEERQIIAHPGVNRILEKPLRFSRLLEVIREDMQEGTMLLQTLRLKFD